VENRPVRQNPREVVVRYITVHYFTFYPRHKTCHVPLICPLYWLHTVDSLAFFSIFTLSGFLFSFPSLIFCLVPCSRLSWIHVSFWVHIKCCVSYMSWHIVSHESPSLTHHCCLILLCRRWLKRWVDNLHSFIFRINCWLPETREWANVL